MPLTRVWLDIILGIIIVGCLVWGFIKGGIREAFGLLGVILGILIGSRLYTKFASLLPINNQVVAKAVSFIIIFVIIALVVYFIGFLVYSLMHFLKVGFIDRVLGVILGVLKGGLFAGGICFFISLFPYGSDVIHKSKIAPVVFKELRLLRALFPHELQKRLKWHAPREPTRSSSCSQVPRRMSGVEVGGSVPTGFLTEESVPANPYSVGLPFTSFHPYVMNITNNGNQEPSIGKMNKTNS